MTHLLEFGGYLWHSMSVIDKKKSELERDANLMGTSAAVFIEYYNQNIPDVFPRVTVKTLDEFQSRYPGLFRDGGEWVIDKHRKKLMDWLISHREEMTES